ncbi:hypothetical protein ACGP04_04180 [Piscirickettsia salmonis]
MDKTTTTENISLNDLLLSASLTTETNGTTLRARSEQKRTLAQ